DRHARTHQCAHRPRCAAVFLGTRGLCAAVCRRPAVGAYRGLGRIAGGLADGGSSVVLAARTAEFVCNGRHIFSRVRDIQYADVHLADAATWFEFPWLPLDCWCLRRLRNRKRSRQTRFTPTGLRVLAFGTM